MFGDYYCNAAVRILRMFVSIPQRGAEATMIIGISHRDKCHTASANQINNGDSMSCRAAICLDFTSGRRLKASHCCGVVVEYD